MVSEDTHVSSVQLCHMRIEYIYYLSVVSTHIFGIISKLNVYPVVSEAKKEL
jgi:hypothetical protein